MTWNGEKIDQKDQDRFCFDRDRIFFYQDHIFFYRDKKNWLKFVEWDLITHNNFITLGQPPSVVIYIFFQNKQFMIIWWVPLN
jgi:hypothetical protein